MPGKRALVVDDSKSARVGLSRMLERYGIEVDSADSAETALVYLKQGGAGDLSARAIKALEGVEGIERIVQPDGYAELGLPAPDRDPQMSQLFLTARTGYSFAGAKGGPVTAEAPQVGGSHGYVSSDPDMDAIFIANGYGIQPGVKLDRVANIDIAPSIAKLLGIDLPSAKGK